MDQFTIRCDVRYTYRTQLVGIKATTVVEAWATYDSLVAGYGKGGHFSDVFPTALLDAKGNEVTR